MDLSDRPAVSADHFAWVLGALCQVHRLPFDAALLLQQFPPPHQRHNLIEAARALGFTAGEVTLPDGKAPTPFIAFLKARPEIPALILRRDDKLLLYLEAGSETPNARGASDFSELFDVHVVLAGREAPEDLPFEDSPRRLGFAWVVPELS